MNFYDYVELEKRAEEHGIGDDPSLAQLLHIIQFKEVVKEGHRRTMSELTDWEKSIAETVERRIKEAAASTSLITALSAERWLTDEHSK